LLFQANQPIRSNFILIHLAVAAKSAGELNNFFEFFSPEFLDKSLLVVACFAFDLRLAHTGRAPHQLGVLEIAVNFVFGLKRRYLGESRGDALRFGLFPLSLQSIFKNH
jgi:hypothetical protein